jgi:orotate phosphoribosyltransferase
MAAEETRVQLRLDQVWFMPAGQPWLKEGQKVTAAAGRVEMLRLALASNPGFHLCLDEVERPGLTYTVDTLRGINSRLGPEDDLFFILGFDAMKQFHRWKEPEELLDLCHWIVVERAGYEGFDLTEFLDRFPNAAGKVTGLSVPLMGISGSEIRCRASTGLPLRYHVPDLVEQYIRERRLYQSDDDDQEWSRESPEDLGAAARKSTLDRLLELAVERGAIKYGQFTLASGRSSSYYFDGRLLSLDPEGARLIAEAMLPGFRQARVAAVGGLTLGADPIVASIALVSGQEGEGIPGFIVRKEVKTHGMGQSTEGPLRPGSRVAIVDDVCTSGGSLFQAIEAAELAGCTVVKVAAVLDRNEGGSAELARRGYPFVALLRATPEGRVEIADNP